jgi:hypothetical protein
MAQNYSIKPVPASRQFLIVFDASAPSSGTLSTLLIIPMATTTTTTWGIAQMERHTADGIVITVHYTVDANDGTYSAGAYGSVGLEAPEGNVIPYADLTPEIVIGWVQEKLGGEEKVEEIEAALQSQIDEQRTPTTAAGVPWS